MITPAFIYALVGVGLFTLGTYGIIVYTHLLRKILAINVIGSGVFLVLVALADRAQPAPDAAPHAMVITGIVVAVSATALALALMLRVKDETGKVELPEERLEK